MIPNDAIGLERVGFGTRRIMLIAGPCVIEGREMALETAQFLSEQASEYEFGFIFKASYAKANRTSRESFRGPGLDSGLKVLSDVRSAVKCPIITDIHEEAEAMPAAQVADMLQIPAFLCRQTRLLEAAGATGNPVNIKKGQFMSPWDMKYAADKVVSAGGTGVTLTERGTFFGYNDLVVDLRSLIIMRQMGYPVIFDATHSIQRPGAGDGRSGGVRDFAIPLARAAVAVGIDGLFIEVHPDPSHALSDAACQLDFAQAATVLRETSAIAEALLNRA